MFASQLFPAVSSIVSLKTRANIKLQILTTAKISSGGTKIGAATSGIGNWGFPRELIFNRTYNWPSSGGESVALDQFSISEVMRNMEDTFDTVTRANDCTTASIGFVIVLDSSKSAS